MPELLLRGTYSTGFRAPSLFDLYSPLQLSVSPVVNDPKNCLGTGNPDFCATQFNTLSGRQQPTQAREVAEPDARLRRRARPRGFSVGVDYFKTEVRT